MYDISQKDFFKLLDDLIYLKAKCISFSSEFGLYRFVKKNKIYKECYIVSEIKGYSLDPHIDRISISINGKTYIRDSCGSRKQFLIATSVRELRLINFE